MAGIKAARAQIVARDDDDRQSFLRKRGFSKGETDRIIATVLDEEGHPPSSIFDFVQGITALARDKPHQDARLELEGKAARLLARSEEHTSELQSLMRNSYAVFCLKKNNTTNTNKT